MLAARLPGNSTYDNPRPGWTPDAGGCLAFLTGKVRTLVPTWPALGPCYSRRAEPPAMVGVGSAGGSSRPATPGGADPRITRRLPYSQYFPDRAKEQRNGGAWGTGIRQASSGKLA